MNLHRCRMVFRAAKIKWLPLIVLALLSSAFFYFRLHQYLTIDTIKTYHASAEAWTVSHYQAAVGLYILVFVGLIACGIPCATILTLLGGFLFGGLAFFYAVFSTTFGGILLYLAIRGSIGAGIAAKSTGWIKKMEHGFQQNAFSYLILLRLIPIFPCWVSNIAAGVLNIPFNTFVIATLLGISPATFIYAMAGRGLEALLTVESAPFTNIILTPSILFPLIGLAILSLFPVIYKSMKKKSTNIPFPEGN